MDEVKEQEIPQVVKEEIEIQKEHDQPITPSVNTGPLMDIVRPEDNEARWPTISISGELHKVFLDVERFSDRVFFKKTLKDLLNKAKDQGILESLKARVELESLIVKEDGEKNDFIFYPIPHSSADMDTLKVTIIRPAENALVNVIEEIPAPSAITPVDSEIGKGVFVDITYKGCKIIARYEHYDDELYLDVYNNARTLAVIFVQTKCADNTKKRFFRDMDRVETLDRLESMTLVGMYNKLQFTESVLKNSQSPTSSGGETGTPNATT